VVLYFMKHMPSEDEGSSNFHIRSRKTYRKLLWDSINYLDFIMEEVKMKDRFSGTFATQGPFAGVTLVADGSDCPVDRPGNREDRNFLSNGRSKENIYSRYNLKYTIACEISTGKICSIMGPEGGSVSDIDALRNGELGVGVIQKWNPFEIILADKGYQGHWKCLTPFKGPDLTPQQDAFNQVLSSVRIIVECTLKRVKQFGVLGSRGRFHCTRDKHKSVFNIACQFTNIAISLQPIWKQPNWFLMANPRKKELVSNGFSNDLSDEIDYDEM